MKYFLIAGEASGDLHASALISELKKRDSKAEFSFLGGDLMSDAAGRQPVIHYRDMAFMGFGEVLRHLGKINRNFKGARAAIKEFQPDCLILIDYPSFNLKMAKFARKLGIPVYYYISPKVWAWKEWRVKTIKKVVDRMFCILPFEVDFYRKHGFEVEYVGNPSVREIDNAKAAATNREEFLKKHALRDKPIIALLPGSRTKEIQTNLPVMVEVARRYPQYKAVVAGAPGIDRDYYSAFTKLPVVFDETYDLLANARAALVTSGTATLETALFGVPQVVMYRDCASKFAYNAMKHLLKVKFISLPNLIADQPIIPELILHLCTADSTDAALSPLLRDTAERRAMVEGYGRMREILTGNNASATAAQGIISALFSADKK